MPKEILVAFEVALLDLVAQASNSPVSAYIGGNRRTITALAYTVDAGARHRHRPADDPTYPTRRVVGLRSWDDAYAQVLGDGTGEHRSNQHSAIWLDLHGKLSVEDASRLVRALNEGRTSGEIAQRIILERPVAKRDLHHIAQLRPSDTRQAGSAERQGITIMIRPDRYPRRELDQLLDAGIGALHLSLHHLGGILPTLNLARYLGRKYPAVEVALSTGATGSAITAQALAALAAALPRIDHLVIPPAILHESTVGSPLKIADYQLTINDSPGLGTSVDLPTHLQQVRRHGRRPSAPQSKGSLQPNVFDHDVNLTKSFAKGDVDSYLLEQAALAYGLSSTRFTRHTFVSHHPKLTTPIGFFLTMSAGTGISSHAIAGDKEETRRCLRDAGLPVAEGDSFTPNEMDHAVRFAQRLGYPVVVKPQRGRQGIGVSTDLRTEDDVRQAFIRAATSAVGGSRGVIVERHILGADYRIMVVGGKVISAILRQPSHVVGDGASNIIDLVADKNVRRNRNPHLVKRPMKIGPEAISMLARQGLTEYSVPDPGQHIRLSGAGNMSRGGESVEVIQETHEGILELAVDALKSIRGLDHAGIDLFITDHRLPVDQQSVVICEINASPQITSHHFPHYGSSRQVSYELVRRSCSRSGFHVDSPAFNLDVEVEIFGKVQAVGYRDWFARIANEFSLSGYIRNLSSGSVKARVAGPAAPVAALVARAISGPRNAFPEYVNTKHISEPGLTENFEVRP